MADMKQEADQQKKKSWASKLFGKNQKPDELINETLTELKDIVGNMRDVFEEFDRGYEEQLEEDRSAWEKVQAKIPFLQTKDIKAQERRRDRIKSNKNHLSELEDNLAKLDMVLNSSSENFEAMGKEYMNMVMPNQKHDDTAVKELEKKMSEMQMNIAEAMGQLSGQIRVMKTAMDNIAGQLDEQGVVLEGIDSKIDVLDTKLDKAQDLIKKVSNQITNNRLLFLLATTAFVGIFASKFVGA